MDKCSNKLVTLLKTTNLWTVINLQSFQCCCKTMFNSKRVLTQNLHQRPIEIPAPLETKSLKRKTLCVSIRESGSKAFPTSERKCFPKVLYTEIRVRDNSYILIMSKQKPSPFDAALRSGWARLGA